MGENRQGWTNYVTRFGSLETTIRRAAVVRGSSPRLFRRIYKKDPAHGHLLEWCGLEDKSPAPPAGSQPTLCQS